MNIYSHNIYRFWSFTIGSKMISLLFAVVNAIECRRLHLIKYFDFFRLNAINHTPSYFSARVRWNVHYVVCVTLITKLVEIIIIYIGMRRNSGFLMRYAERRLVSVNYDRSEISRRRKTVFAHNIMYTNTY